MNTNIENISENKDQLDFEAQYLDDLRDEYRLQDRIDRDECRLEFEN